MRILLIISLLTGGAAATAQTVAIRGYDAVAFFTSGQAVKGADSLAVEFAGQTWRFASASHRKLFQENPESYLPQFDGFCAYAAGNNYVYEADPEAWTIVDGKLYFNYSLDIRKMWTANRDSLIAAGHKNWPGLKKQ